MFKKVNAEKQECLTTSEAVDRLAEIRKILHPLLTEHDSLESRLKAETTGRLVGRTHYAMIAHSWRAAVAWKEVAKKCDAPQKWIDAFTTKIRVSQVRLYPHRKPKNGHR